MPCTYERSQQEIDEENRKIELAFIIACKAMGILEKLPKLNFKLENRFTKEELAWWKKHQQDDIERKEREAAAVYIETKKLEEEIEEKKKQLKALKKK